jgi:hypothetical protein
MRKFSSKQPLRCCSIRCEVQIYCTEPDHGAYGRSGKEPDEVRVYLADATNHWAYGQCQALRERCTLRVPGANALSSNVAGAQGIVDLDKEWVRSVVVHEGHDVVLVAVALSVYGFSLEDGARVFAWEDLHMRRISHVRLCLDVALYVLCVCDQCSTALSQMCLSAA